VSGVGCGYLRQESKWGDIYRAGYDRVVTALHYSAITEIFLPKNEVEQKSFCRRSCTTM
jgi:hypothetical protein